MVKRPFSINKELERNEMTKLVVKLGRDNSKKETERHVDSDGFYRYVKVFHNCPCCNLINNWRKMYSFHEENMDEFDYETGYLYIIEHIKKMVRLHGEKKHMQFIIDFFGKENGTMILEHWARKNIMVAKLIADFIKEVKLTVEVQER